MHDEHWIFKQAYKANTLTHVKVFKVSKVLSEVFSDVLSKVLSKVSSNQVNETKPKQATFPHIGKFIYSIMYVCKYCLM
jgi:hypothetical protein